jgi:endonuclease-3
MARRGSASSRLAPPAARAYNSSMARKESRQSRAARTEAIFERLAAANPAPKGELKYINPFTLLVAVVLSAQATDAGVNKATPALFAIADTPEKMAALGEERITEKIKTIGLYRTKARNLTALSRAIVERHGGETPRSREELEALPGVGRKTANVVLNTVFGEPTLAVDTHVFRVANRLAIAPGKTPREVEDGLMRVVPDRFLLHAHHWLILHGRYVCMARKPLCGVCVVVDLCPYEPKNLPSETG